MESTVVRQETRVPKNDRVPHNHTINRLDQEDETVHRWYRFVLSFPPRLVSTYLTKFDLNFSKTLLDPFCGTGTSVVEAKLRGIPSVGIEAHPMAHFASTVKTQWDVNPAALEAHATEIADQVTRKLRAQGIEDDPIFGQGCEEMANLQTLSEEQASLLLRNSISPLPLHKVLTLLDALRRDAQSAFINHELIALATSVVTYSSNLKFGPEVGITKPKHDSPVVQPWLRCVRKIVEDLKKVQALEGVPSVVHCGDARVVSAVVPKDSIDAVITSPPYPNEKDYTRTTRLGARLAYVVGDQASYLRIMIRTGQLLGEIAESLGYEVLALELFRTRLATATREQLREEVLVLRWPV